MLSATEGTGKRSNESEIVVLKKDSEAGQVMVEYLGMDEKQQQRLLGYMKALKELS